VARDRQAKARVKGVYEPSCANEPVESHASVKFFFVYTLVTGIVEIFCPALSGTVVGNRASGEDMKSDGPLANRSDKIGEYSASFPYTQKLKILPRSKDMG